jgi:hypothetical protein
MPRGSPAIKLAISVERETHGRVVRAAAEENLSVSAWITEAARRSLRIRDGLLGVTEWENEHGKFTAEELSEARRRLTAAPSRKKMRAR